MIEKIENNGEIMAIIVYKDYRKEGLSFITHKEALLQLGYINQPAGYKVQPHIHNLVTRQTKGTQEVLLIKKGRIKIDFYGKERTYLGSKELISGDVILLATGGHGITMLEPTELIEVKTGPYVEEEDKIRF